MSEIIASTYELIEKIGSGGGGNVFLANHLRLNKKVILKADKRKLTISSELLRREVDVLKNLSHSHIPKVYDFFAENETVYTVMDYIEGESLDKPLKRGERFSQPQVIEWAKELLEALDYLHSPIHGDPPHGYVHGDIKPANMMKTPLNGICLIDFNISLVLGEENVVGCSAGYASPEHYGLDYSSGFQTATNTEAKDESTVLLTGDETIPLIGEETVPIRQTSVPSPSPKKVVPDIRSDIYSVGATLYHLLSGSRPARNAIDVIRLSEKEFSASIVRIISKAMNPNPDLRYQTAREMLGDFRSLHENDPRKKRLNRRFGVSAAVFGFLFSLGIFSSFVGLKRIQATENRLKLAEYSKSALSAGNADSAIEYAIEALSEESGLFSPPPEAQAQSALADALGVYDLSDGLKPSRTAELPAAPLSMALSPSGKTCACLSLGECTVFDTDTAEIMLRLPANPSALAEVEYLSETVLLYASDEGVCAYDLARNEKRWTGVPATTIALSADGKKAAVTEHGSDLAVIYETETGTETARISFGDKRQSAAYNAIFANPNDCLFALGEDGEKLAVSFSDGSLMLYDPEDPKKDWQIFDGSEGYAYFNGGFYGDYFAFSASNGEGSDVAVINCRSAQQTTGFQSDRVCSFWINDDGIYVRGGNLVVKLNPETGDQLPVAAASEVIGSFTVSGGTAITAIQKKIQFFEGGTDPAYAYPSEFPAKFLLCAEDTAVAGFSDSPAIRILKYKKYEGQNLLTYTPDYAHDEARLSANGSAIMLFSYRGFRIYDRSGNLLNETVLPDPDRIYDQQYRRTETESTLEVLYYDGIKRIYNAETGALLREETASPPDRSLYEEFFTDGLRIESPLHGTPTAYDLQTGTLVAELEKDAYLTYVTQIGENVIAQYVTTDGDFYGILMDRKCETLARLPRLCDIVEDRLIFDLPTGYIRESRIYTINELIESARK